jgi:hypothetical protein
MNTHLEDLTKSIAVKESHMTQLIQRKSKYNQMRVLREEGRVSDTFDALGMTIKSAPRLICKCLHQFILS